MKAPAIAIDGPAASGKSTVAKRVAKLPGFTFINIGVMYHAIAWYLAQGGKFYAIRSLMPQGIRHL